MARDPNLITFRGTVQGTPRTIPHHDTVVCEFTVVSQARSRDRRTGAWTVTATHPWRCVAWRGCAEHAATLRDGEPVMVQARPAKLPDGVTDGWSVERIARDITGQ